MLEANISELHAGRRKKTLSRYGKISISKEHPFCDGANGFQISPYLLELMVYAGQSGCYERSNEVLQKFIDIQVSTTQVYLVMENRQKASKCKPLTGACKKR